MVSKILTPYLILVWSEWNPLDYNGFVEMGISVRKDFDGTGMSRHRAELIQRLGCILGELDRRSGHLDVKLEDSKLWRRSPAMKDRYGQPRRILEEMDRKPPNPRQYAS